MVAASAPHGTEPPDRLRHGRHLDRRVALCRPLRAGRRESDRRRPHPRADDADPHHRRRRRIDLPVRWDALPGRPGIGRRPAGSGLLSRRRAADGDRLQPVPRPDRPGEFPGGVRPRRRPAARSRRIAARGCRKLPTRSAAPRASRKSPRASSHIAVDNMAAAIRKISIARGHDVTRYTLACFGGAGGQHACRVADALGMERILVHPLAGRAVGLWHRPRRGEGGARGELAEAARRGFFRRRPRAGSCGAKRPRRPGLRREPNPLRTPRPAAHAGQRHDDHRRTWLGR